MKSFTRSVLTSIFSTGCDYGTMMLLFGLVYVDYRIATFLGTIVGFLTNFVINRYWAFEATSGHLGWQFVRVLPVQVGSTLLQTFGVWAMVALVYASSPDDITKLQVTVAKIVISVLVYLAWNYPMNRFWVFRTTAQSRRPAA